MDTATVLITIPHIWKMLQQILTPRQLWIRWYYISNKLKIVKVFPLDFIWTVYFTSGIFSSGQLYYLWRFHTCKCRRRIRCQVWWWSQRWPGGQLLLWWKNILQQFRGHKSHAILGLTAKNIVRLRSSSGLWTPCKNIEYADFVIHLNNFKFKRRLQQIRLYLQ